MSFAPPLPRSRSRSLRPTPGLRHFLPRPVTINRLAPAGRRLTSEFELSARADDAIVAGLASIAAAGHRVVHGGDQFVEPAPVTAGMLDRLRRIAPLDPEHLPGEIALIEAIGKAVPGVPQVACFDTAFHRSMPSPA